MAQDNDAVFVPVLPAFDKFFPQLSAESKKSGERAGADLASAMGKGVERAGTLAEKAGDQMKRAQNRAADAAESLRQKNLALEAVMSKESATALEIARATDAVTKASRAKETADDLAARAVKKHASAQEDYQKVLDETNDAVELGTSHLDEYSAGLEGVGGSIKNMIGAAAGIGSIGAAIGAAMDVSGATNKINNQLGLTGDVARQTGDDIRSVLSSGMASGADEAAEAIGALNSQFKYLGSEGEQTAADLADNFLGFSRTFDVDLAEATQTAGQLILNGLATDVEDAADLMVTAMQRVPAQMRDELPEIINEYGTNFANLGFSGEEAFSLLVAQAEKGKWALDKTGDALKEFTIRGSDMSKTSVEAYETLGLSAEDMSNAIAVGGEGARDALQSVATELLNMENPQERANTAIALFGTQLEDLGIDQIPGFLEGLTGAQDGMEGFEGASQGLADTMSNSLQGRLDKVKGTAMSLASDGFMRAWDMGEKLASWARESQAWLIPLGVGIGAVAAGLAAAAIQQNILAAGGLIGWLSKATSGTILFNAALWANPVTWIVAGIAALVAGLVLFFTKTETGRKAWDTFTTALGDGWDWFTDKLSKGWAWVDENVWTPFLGFLDTARDTWGIVWGGINDAWTSFTDGIKSGWENYIKPAWDAIVSAGQLMATILGTIVLAPILLAWNVLSAGIQWGWENLIKPAWDAIVSAAQWMWNNVLKPTFDFIRLAWMVLVEGMKWGWENLLKPAWDALQTAAMWLWNSVLMPVFGFIKAGWDALLNGMKWAWENILKPTWDAVSNALNWLWSNTVSPVLSWIGDKWQAMGDGMKRVWEWVDSNVLVPFRNGLDVLKGWFDTTVDAIGRGWNRIKDLVKEPISFVVNTVYNKGIKPAWDAVAGFVGMDDKKLPDIAFASGGVLPGYSPGVDNYTFVDPQTGFTLGLGGGEAIMRPEFVRAVGGAPAIDALNKVAKNGGVSGVSKALGQGAQFADGGVLDKRVQQTMAALAPEHGKPYQWGGVGNPSWDCSGLWSGITQSLGGGNLFGGRIFNTVSLMNNPGAFGYTPGLSGRVTVGVSADHMAGTIDGTNIESASMPKGVQIGGSAWGSDNGYFTNTYTLTELLGNFVSGGNGGGGGNPIGRLAKAAWDKVMSLVPETPSYPGVIGEWPGKARSTFVDTLWNWVKSKLPFGGGETGVQGGVAAGVEQWRDLVNRVLAAKGFDTSMADTVLRRMNQESGGNPAAINNWDVNAVNGTPSKGLMQVIDPTFAAHKDAGYDDIWDPESNIRASMNYAINRYGSLSAAYDRAGGYHDGGLAPAGQGLLKKTALEPEMVLNPAMTQAFIDWMGAIGRVNDIDMRTIANEFVSAFEGGDFGVGELTRALGGNGAIAQAVLDGTETMGRAYRGFTTWASENEDHGRMGTPEEWARHFGAAAVQELGSDALGLVGLDGLADITLSDSTVNLLNTAADTLNGMANAGELQLPGGFRFGHAWADMAQPVSILDDNGRIAKTDTAQVSDTAEAVADTPAVSGSGTAGGTSGSTGGTSGSTGGTTLVLKVPNVTDELRDQVKAINDKTTDLEVKVEKLEEDQTAAVTDGLSMIV